MNLSGRCYLLTALLLSLGVVGEWGSPHLQGVWRLPMAVLVVTLVVEGVLSRRNLLTINRQLNQNIHLGRPEQGELVVSNHSASSLLLEIVDESPASIDSSLVMQRWAIPASSKQQRPFNYLALQLGKVSWEQVHVRMQGCFGLAWWPRRMTVESQLTVVPDRLHGNERHHAVNRSQGDLRHPTEGCGLELLGLREYNFGDPLRAMDWKATARSGRPMVRIFSEDQHLEMLLLIDVGQSSSLKSGRLSRLGHYLNVAARLAEKSLANGDYLTVITFADQVKSALPNLHGAAGLRRLRSLLEKQKPVARESNPLNAVMQARSLMRQRSLVVMLTDLDEGDGAAQLVKALSLLRPKHLPLVAGLMDEDVLRLLHQPANHWLDPYRTLSAYEMADNWRRTRLRLERLGVPVVLCQPDQLDARILATYDTVKNRRLV